MSVIHDILEIYQLFSPAELRAHLTINRTDMDLCKYLIQQLMDIDVESISFGFSGESMSGCPFSASIDLKDADKDLCSESAVYYSAPCSNTYSFDGYEIYRSKEKSLAFFFACYLFNTGNCEKTSSFAYFCLTHCAAAFSDFVAAFSDYVSKLTLWDSSCDQILLWILEILEQYLHLKEHAFYNVEALANAINPNMLSHNFGYNAQMQNSIWRSVEIHTEAMFKDNNVFTNLDNAMVLEVLSKIIGVVKGYSQNLSNCVYKWFTEYEGDIRLLLQECLGDKYIYSELADDFRKICNNARKHIHNATTESTV